MIDQALRLTKYLYKKYFINSFVGEINFLTILSIFIDHGAY